MDVNERRAAERETLTLQLVQPSMPPAKTATKTHVTQKSTRDTQQSVHGIMKIRGPRGAFILPHCSFCQRVGYKAQMNEASCQSTRQSRQRYQIQRAVERNE